MTRCTVVGHPVAVRLGDSAFTVLNRMTGRLLTRGIAWHTGDLRFTNVAGEEVNDKFGRAVASRDLLTLSAPVTLDEHDGEWGTWPDWIEGNEPETE